MALTLNNMAVAYKYQGKAKRAVRLYREALGIFEKTLEEGHPNIKVCRENLGRLIPETKSLT